MRELVGQDLTMDGRSVTRQEAAEYYRERGQPFKLELLEGIPEGEPITMYTIGTFTDLCRGPHLDLQLVSGAPTAILLPADPGGPGRAAGRAGTGATGRTPSGYGFPP